jgi:hypothetical protein
MYFDNIYLFNIVDVDIFFYIGQTSNLWLLLNLEILFI